MEILRDNKLKVTMLKSLPAKDFFALRELDGYRRIEGTKDALLEITVKNLEWLDAHGFTEEVQFNLIHNQKD